MLNILGGDGFEAYYHFGGGKGKDLAANIEKRVKEIGQNSRGIKVRMNNSGQDYFYFVRETVCPAVIVEGVFVDNKKDYQIAYSLSQQIFFGEAYAKGILDTLGIQINDIEDSEQQDEKMYYVQIGAFKNEENALRLQEKAIGLGLNAYIKE